MMDELSEDYRCPYTEHICNNAWDCSSCETTAEVRKFEKDKPRCGNCTNFMSCEDLSEVSAWDDASICDEYTEE